MPDNRSIITLHMVASLDGFIAKKDGSTDWLHSTDHFEDGKTLSDEDIAAFLEKIDCYVMGSKTYEKALELGWPYGDTPVYVVSHRQLPKERDSIHFYSGDVEKLVNQKLKPNFQGIWIVGGAMLTRSFLQLGLADEIVVSMMPIIVGDGIPFFDHIGQEIPLHLMSSTAYKDGMVELSYEIRKEID